MKSLRLSLEGKHAAAKAILDAEIERHPQIDCRRHFLASALGSGRQALAFAQSAFDQDPTYIRAKNVFLDEATHIYSGAETGTTLAERGLAVVLMPKRVKNALPPPMSI